MSGWLVEEINDFETTSLGSFQPTKVDTTLKSSAKKSKKSNKGKAKKEEEEVKVGKKKQRKVEKTISDMKDKMSEEEKNWLDISLNNLPPLPATKSESRIKFRGGAKVVKKAKVVTKEVVEDDDTEDEKVTEVPITKPKANPKTKAEPKTKSDTKTDIKSDTKANTKPDTKTQVNPKIQPQSNKKKSGKKGKMIRVDDIPWKPVEIDAGEALEFDADQGGFYGLEVIDGLDLEWAKSDLGNTLQFKVVNESKLGARTKVKNIFEEPLSQAEMEKIQYTHVDDFVDSDEEVQEKTNKKGRKGPSKFIEEDFIEKSMVDESDEEEDNDDEEKDDDNDDEEMADDDNDEDMTDEDNDEDMEDDVKEDKKEGDLKNESEPFDFTQLQLKAKPQPKLKSEPKSEPKTKNPSLMDDYIPNDTYLSNWGRFNLSPKLVRALESNGFSSPTPIQEKVLPHALKGKDVIGCAETGSGKTLAFGLPMLQKLAMIDTLDPKNANTMFGLILTPTRELAIQVTDHLKKMAEFIHIKIGTVVGGMSIQKQERVLAKTPHLLVATPGRLWQLMAEDESYERKIRGVKFFVLDEADRMVEKGHFKELTDILDSFNKKNNANDPNEKVKVNRQTLIFSATLDQELAVKVNKRTSKGKSKKNESPIGMILDRIRFREGGPVQIDVVGDKKTSHQLVERRIDCLNNEKDLYLYYFITRYPGRTLVFVNSIDTIRRLVPTLQLLGIAALPLHAQMQQRQRLKNVDRFKTSANCVMIASDVASRGLDIPDVDHIVHYQLARSPDLYVHRAGRTARANKVGISIMLTCPDEVKSYRLICHALGRSSVQTFPVDIQLLARLKERVIIAKQIDAEQHKLDKKQAEKNWAKRSAKELDIELDSDFENTSSEDDEGNTGHSVIKMYKGRITSLKNQLNHCIDKSVFPKNISQAYITGADDRDGLLELARGNDPRGRKGLANTNALTDASK